MISQRDSAEFAEHPKQPRAGSNIVDLLPCPFCGISAKLSPLPNAQTWWRVRCDNYHCGGTTWAMEDAEQAIGAWSRRLGGQV